MLECFLKIKPGDKLQYKYRNSLKVITHEVSKVIFWDKYDEEIEIYSADGRCEYFSSIRIRIKLNHISDIKIIKYQ